MPGVGPPCRQPFCFTGPPTWTPNDMERRSEVDFLAREIGGKESDGCEKWCGLEFLGSGFFGCFEGFFQRFCLGGFLDFFKCSFYGCSTVFLWFSLF